MRKSKIATIVYILAALQVCLAVGASAATQEYDWVRTLGSRVNWVEVISLPKFGGDINLLTGIEIALETSMDCEIGVENLAQVPSDLSVDLSITTQVKKGTATLVSKTYQCAHTFENMPAHDDNLDWAGDSGTKIQQYLYGSPTWITYSVPTTDFAEYVGSGSVNFEVSALRDYWIPTSTGGSMAAYYKADAPARVKITYSYIPEPSGILAVLTGLVGAVGVVMRRRTY